MNRFTRFSISRPRWTLTGWLLLVALALPLAFTLTGSLKAGGFEDPNAEGAQSQQTLQRAFGDPRNTLEVVVHSDGDVRSAVQEAADAAGRFPDVTGVSTWQQNPAWLSTDGSTGLVQLSLDSDNTTTQTRVAELRDELAKAMPEGADANVTGAAALDFDLNVQSKADATHAEMIAFPLLFIVLMLVFRSVGAMLVPLVLSGLALVVTQALGRVAAQFTDVSILFTNGVSLIGLAVAVDYSLFIIKRYREELSHGSGYRPALETAMRTAGHSVLFSALAVVVALSALFIPGLMVFTSIGLAGVLVTLVSLAMSMTLLPAVLTLMGRRIDFGSLPSRKRARDAVSSGPTVASGSRLRPAVTVALLGLGFLALAWPMHAITLQVPVASASILPADMDSRVGVERLSDSIGTEGLFPIQVVLSGSGEGAVLAAGEQALAARDLPNVTDVAWDRKVASDGADEVTRLVVFTDSDPDSSAAHTLVADLRADLPTTVGPAVDVGVTGATARGADFDRAVVDSIVSILGAVALATLILLSWAFRSWRLPLLALVLNALVVSGSLGLLTLLYQGVLDEEINSVTPLLLFAIMFGLSMDYLVIMISRMRELFVDGASHEEAVSGGVRRTAGLVNGAAVIMIAVFLSFVSAEISIVRQLGLGLAMAVALDALVVRLFLMPAALRLIGPKVWGRGAQPPQPPSADPMAERSPARALASGVAS